MSDIPLPTSIRFGDDRIHLHQLVVAPSGRAFTVVATETETITVVAARAGFDGDAYRRTIDAAEWSNGWAAPTTPDGEPVWGY